jgi:hypothetical protein
LVRVQQAPTRRRYSARSASLFSWRRSRLLRCLRCAHPRGREFLEPAQTVESTAMLVNASFTDRVLGSRNPVGRRIRYVAAYEHKLF